MLRGGVIGFGRMGLTHFSILNAHPKVELVAVCDSSSFILKIAAKIKYLWDRPDLCRAMGQAGYERVIREYSPNRYCDRLVGLYKRAIEFGPGGRKAC